MKGASKEAMASMGIHIPKLGSQLELQSEFPNHMKAGIMYQNGEKTAPRCSSCDLPQVVK
jgi:sporulation-control protein spo0M